MRLVDTRKRYGYPIGNILKLFFYTLIVKDQISFIEHQLVLVGLMSHSNRKYSYLSLFYLFGDEEYITVEFLILAV